MANDILVTGAAGFAGSHLIDLLVRSGTRVIAWHRPGGSPPREQAGRAMGRRSISWISAQVQAAIDRAAACRRVSLRRRGPRRARMGSDGVDVGDQRARHAPCAAGAGTIGQQRAGRRAELGARLRAANEPLTEQHAARPSSPYGVSKLAQEMLGAGGAWRARRHDRAPFNHFGPRQDPSFAAPGFARRIADIERGRWAPEISVGNLDAQRDLTDVRDTVRAYQMILERGQPDGPITSVPAARSRSASCSID
jgi:GDP-4-dehydro-6-deoxy-D-mannose reductase